MGETVPASAVPPDLNLDPTDTEIRDLLLSVLLSLVDEGGKLELLMVHDSHTTAFHVRAAASDVGKLIGRNGRTAQAIRVILGAIALKHRRRFTFDVVSPPDSFGS